MKISIHKSQARGQVRAPSSKSYTIRGLMCAALAAGESRLIYPLAADDTEAALGVLEKIGVGIVRGSGRWCVRGGGFKAPESALFCNESAATLRFMTAICAVVPGECRLMGKPGLARRPVNILIEALNNLGVEVSLREGGTVVVKGGHLKGGVTLLRGDVSSQYVSALLLVSPLAEGPVKVRLTTPLESRAYVRMTLECLNHFGVQVESAGDLQEFWLQPQAYAATRYQVEGDWSSVSYLLGLGAIGGPIELTNLNTASLQGDRLWTGLLEEMGARLTPGQNMIEIEAGSLKGIRADLNECIDLLPTAAVMAALAEGQSRFSGIRRARLKESNRVGALREGLEKVGIRVVEEEDSLTVNGGKVHPAVIDAHNDHRIAMAFSLLGAHSGGIVIEGAECVSKTYPEYWRVLKNLGVKIDEQ